MKKTILATVLVMALGLVLCVAGPASAARMGTAFIYQARLLDANAPADGLYDLRFKLFNDPNVILGKKMGSTIDINDLDVVEGYFAVWLDFAATDANIFNGAAH